ncbi:Fimbrillin-like [Xylanibacter ruminicola]|uniref:Fimbrillin-like n=1 Tax=Xylanibacter ruminicola TaxID=839 RepID=A0A1H3ZUL7_XYLRU|nr:fimbrillin family protein [Xylanibacter ruminicola]SEA27413.1 Fimbrillin-like [Xylanibacter ruminicola]
MLKKANKYIALSAVCMLTISACSTDEGLSASNNQDKTPIELSAGVVGESPATQHAATRTTVTSGTGSAFSKTTSVYMVLKSENSADATADALYTRTIGYLQGGTTGSKNSIDFSSSFARYWEDSYSRNSQVSAYATCVPGYYLASSVNESLKDNPNGTSDSDIWSDGSSEFYNNEWSSSYGNTTLAWPLRSATADNQNTGDFVNSQDLCFSNNLSNLGTDSRLTFSTETKTFGKGELVFNHALTRVTFKIKKGDGFTTSDPFAFSNDNENIVILGVNTSGTFDFTAGGFSSLSTGDIKQFAVTDNRSTDGATYAYELNALLVPGSDLSSTTAGQIYFTIDNNLYQLSKSTLMTALDGKTLSDNTTSALDAENKMRPGVHYVFTMTVGKKKVSNFTASVVEWETVTAEETTPTNARITMTLMDNNAKITGEAEFALYRSTVTSSTIDDSYENYSWTTGYTPAKNKAQLVEHSEKTGVYAAQDAEKPNADWYWPDNKTFYHFRTVMPKATVVNEGDTNGNYISLAAGFNKKYIDSGTYTDVCWGAPFASTTSKLNYDYDVNGFDGKDAPTPHQLYKAIGPTAQTINMIMFHMMSDVTIKLTTTGDADPDKVDLTNAKMQLSNVYKEGNVLMGNGLVVPTETSKGTITNETGTNTYQVDWHYGFIPQSLANVVLTITTADNNQYFVTMNEVLAATVGSTIIANPYTQKNGKYVIDRWLPNYQYTYTFKLSKSGITQISASLADWENVEAGDDNVQIQ